MGHGPQDESITLQKLEATAENTATSEHSSSLKTCAPPPRQEESTKKRSDAQVRIFFPKRPGEICSKFISFG